MFLPVAKQSILLKAGETIEDESIIESLEDSDELTQWAYALVRVWVEQKENEEAQNIAIAEYLESLQPAMKKYELDNKRSQKSPESQ